VLPSTAKISGGFSRKISGEQYFRSSWVFAEYLSVQGKVYKNIEALAKKCLFIDTL